MKRVLSLALAVVLVLGIAITGSAATVKITGINDSFSYYKLGASNNSLDKISSYTDFPDDQRCDQTYKLYLSPDEFTWDGTAPALGHFTTGQLSNAKITVKKKVTKGGDLIKSVELKTETVTMKGVPTKLVYIEVKTIEEFVSVSGKDFDWTIYLAKNGSKQTQTEFQFTGTMKNEETTVDTGDDEVNLSEGQYAKAEGYIKAIKVDTGNGLYINAKMFEDKKYYAKSTQDITAADDEIIAKYPEIDTIYTLNTVNMNSAGNTVEFDIDEKYFVYDADGKYIGTTADKLPFSGKYYLATKKIDMGTEEAPEPTEEPTIDTPEPYEPPVVTGGDDVPANVNDNPGTGK